MSVFKNDIEGLNILTKRLQNLLDNPLPENKAWLAKLKITLVSISDYQIMFEN